MAGWRVEVTASRLSVGPAPWVSFAVTAAASVAGLVFVVLGRSVQAVFPNMLQVIIPLGYGLMGALIWRRQPQNPIGRLFAAVGVGLSVTSGLAQSYAVYVLRVEPNRLPFGMFASWLSSPAFDSLFFLVLFLLLQLFPDGRPLGPRWRVAVWLTALGSLLGLGQAVQHYNLDPPLSSFDNPYVLRGSATPLLDFAGMLSSLLLLIGAFASVASVIVRYRRSTGTERQQLRWFAAAVLMIIALSLLTLVLYVLSGADFSNAIFPIGVTLLPVATGIAILRYRLYDIDFLIRKTIVYGCLVAALAIIYFTGIAVLGGMFRAVSGQSGTLAVTASTLLVAIGFQPLRLRIQAVVDHRFYRSRYDAQQSLERFSGRLRNEVDLEALSGELVEVVHQSLHPRHTSLWLIHEGRGGSVNRPDGDR